MPQEENYYTRLGLLRDATPEEIRTAYFEAARQLHPDTNPDPGALESFLRVQEAYETLTDPAKREIYDANLPLQETNAPAISVSVMYSQSGIARMDETQLIYVLLELTSIPDPGANTSPPINLCLVIDRSTSMQGARMDMVKASVLNLIKQLRPLDIVSVITYSDRAEVLISPTRVSEISKVISRISLIQTSGGTEIYYGLEAGLHQLKQNQNSSSVSHLILLTDGRTYGDEEDCLLLAEQAANAGIGISGLGIGNDWNDTFLDNLAACSGGSSTYISTPKDLQHFFDDKSKRLGRTYAESVTLDFEKDPYTELRFAFRLQPESGPLPLASPMRVGTIAQFHSLRILLEFLVNRIPENNEEIVLAKGHIKMEIPTRVAPSARLRLNLRLPVRPEGEPDLPPQAIVDSMSRLTLYRMQEKARQEVQAGNTETATKYLQHIATHLITKGERDLAHAVLVEADSINKNHQFSKEGDKRIKYGTRALLLPQGQERSER